MLQYQYTLIYVADVAATITFYEQAFGFARTFVTPENDYGELATGGVTIGFVSHALAKSNLATGFHATTESAIPVGINLSFVTDTLEAAVEQAVAAGAKLYEPISEKPWGQQTAYVLDNNGVLIELCTPAPAV